MLSKYFKNIIDQYGIKVGSVNKLIKVNMFFTTEICNYIFLNLWIIVIITKRWKIKKKKKRVKVRLVNNAKDYK